jgi:anaerobic magnesium-protoporphyrin IX monomethyl ester cyclase
MKVLFVNVVKDLAVQKAHYPLGFGYMAAYCHKNGLDLNISYAEDLSTLNSVAPDVVAFTCITENFNLCKKYAAQVKRFNPKTKTLIGGVHVSAVPDSLTDDFDVGIIGEGEQTFYELAKNNFKPSSNIAGLYYNGAKTADRPLIEPLDNIPYPDRTIYQLGIRESYVFTSRGCSYRCKFCSSSRFWKRVRLHSAEYVAGELLELKKSGVKHVTIFDDTFLLSMPRVKAICDLVKDYGLTFNIAARANQITEESVSILMDMGVVKVGMGLESNSARVLSWLEKGNTPQDNQNAVDVLHKARMPFVASFIRDTPVETKEDLAVTYRFIAENCIEFAMYHLMPFPNTPIYDGRRDWGACRIKQYNQPNGAGLLFKRAMTKIFAAKQSSGGNNQ